MDDSVKFMVVNLGCNPMGMFRDKLRADRSWIGIGQLCDHVRTQLTGNLERRMSCPLAGTDLPYLVGPVLKDPKLEGCVL